MILTDIRPLSSDRDTSWYASDIETYLESKESRRADYIRGNELWLQDKIGLRSPDMEGRSVPRSALYQD